MIASTTSLKTLSFEVHGKVQGVFFRKHTKLNAEKLGLVGYCQNMPTGTVKGIVQGATPQILKFKEWVSKTGSPKSKIDECVFQSERSLTALQFSQFEIRR